MNCDEAGRWLSAFFDGEVTRTQQELIERHLASCASCAEKVRAMGTLSDGLRSLARTSPQKKQWREVIQQWARERERRPAGAHSNGGDPVEFTLRETLRRGRERQGVLLRTFAGQVTRQLGLPERLTSQVHRRLTQLENGLGDPRAVDCRVWEAISHCLGLSVEMILVAARASSAAPRRREVALRVAGVARRKSASSSTGPARPGPMEQEDARVTVLFEKGGGN